MCVLVDTHTGCYNKPESLTVAIECQIQLNVSHGCCLTELQDDVCQTCRLKNFSRIQTKVGANTLKGGAFDWVLAAE